LGKRDQSFGTVERMERIFLALDVHGPQVGYGGEDMALKETLPLDTVRRAHHR
jgi:hypothetical protein